MTDQSAQSGVSPVVFLHGAGEFPDAWVGVRARLPEGFTSFAPEYVDPVFTFTGGVANVLAALDERGIARANLVGLSLGAMTAAMFAAQYPQRVDKLILSSGQVKPPHAYMRVMLALFRIMPEAWLQPKTATKANMTSVFDEISRLDLREDLARIQAMTLVLCGAWDVPTRRAARSFAARIRGARREVVPGAFHAWHSKMPQEFASRVVSFLSEAPGTGR